LKLDADLGRDIVLWLGIAMMVSMLTGAYLWWPRNWRSAFTLKRSQRGRLLDYHNMLSVYFYVPLLLIVFSGVYFLKPHWIEPVVSAVSTAQPADPNFSPLSRVSCGSNTTIDQAITVAQTVAPRERFVFISIPKAPEPYWIQFAPEGNIGSKGLTQVWVNRDCPIISYLVRATTFADKFGARMHALHKDMMLGTFGQIVVFISGLLIPLAFVTGVLLWIGKRSARTAAARQRTLRAPI
jgi:uncharacterized iron-regulated membrane protein